MRHIRVQMTPLDVRAELERAQTRGPGALVSFVGQVRELEAGEPILGLHLEHYPGMTERALEAIADEALKRWPLTEVVLIHRYGDIPVGEAIVLVLTASSHRRAAFEACEFLMDYLKTEAPFWKKTLSATGGHWVEAKASDDAARQRWEST